MAEKLKVPPGMTPEERDAPIVIASSTGVSIFAPPNQSMSLTKAHALDTLEGLAIVLGYRVSTLPSGASALVRAGWDDRKAPHRKPKRKPCP